MRPGQNKRMRGRNNNPSSSSSNTHRRGPNPLTRSYDSNGPDIKVRGTAAHVAEKYVLLARDANSSGDPVLAESYLQHAEHYYRVIAAAQSAQFQQQNGGAAAKAGEAQQDSDEESDDDFDSGVSDRFTYRAPPNPFQPQAQNGQPLNPAQQPYANGQPPAEGDEQPAAAGHGPQPDPQPRAEAYSQPQPRGDFQQPRQDRGDRPQRFDRPRQERFDRPRQDRRDRNNEPRPPRGPDDGEQPAVALPAFITGGAPRPQPVQDEAVSQQADTPAAQADEGAMRPRRRRNRFGNEDGGPQGGQGEPVA